MYGTHGGIFTDVQDAQQWLKSQLLQPPIDLEGLHSDLAAESTNHVGLYYGSTTGVTEKVAFDIQATWQQLAGETLVPINIGTVKDLSELLAYDYLILGVSTWNIGQLQDDWEIAFPQFDSIDLTGRKIALFGIGDQYGYPDNFLDALGILGNELIRRGATLVGYTDPSGYEFSTSLALENGQFMGLAIDEINQPELTESRISQWVTEVMDVFGLRYRAASTPDASTF
ncbi:MAG: flavodoxin [Anaerolineaceae bacterium]|nr:flavodoxin [Anaerolineaceae bacterium]